MACEHLLPPKELQQGGTHPVSPLSCSVGLKARTHDLLPCNIGSSPVRSIEASGYYLKTLNNIIACM